jgi:hypothetical protein
VRGVQVHTDIVEVGYYIPYTYDKRERPAQGGVSIGHLDVTAGTLGGLVCGPAREQDENSILILSNNHVLAAINNGVRGDHIVQPGTYDGGACHRDCIATLERFVPIDFSDGGVNYVDCAVALPYDTSDVSFEIHDIGLPNLAETYTLTPDDVVHATKVQKTGRTTQHTVGYVSAIDWKGTVLYEWDPAYFESQVVVESLDGTPVALGGDSGSLVLTMEGKICALLFAGPTSGTHYIANRIGEVFNRLNVSLCCAPTEAVRDTDVERFLPDLRRVRDRLSVRPEYREYFELYGKHSGKLMEAIQQRPELRRMARDVIKGVGEAIRDPERQIDEPLVDAAVRLIDSVVETRADDAELVRDMKKATGIVRKASGRTLAEVLRMLVE